MLRALLFDMNGVVVNDMAFHEQAWLAIAARHGRTLTVEEYRREMNGRGNRDSLVHVFGERLSAATLRALQCEKEECYRTAFGPHLAPLPGLSDLLDAARAAGLRVALVTSAPPENIDFVLDGLAFRGKFDVVVGEADVERGKPDPEIFVTAAFHLGSSRSPRRGI